MRWQDLKDGTMIAEATARAEEWSKIRRNGQHEFTARLAAVGFVACCEELKLEPEWDPINWNRVRCGIFRINVHVDTGFAHDTFATGYAAQPNEWNAIVRILSGQPKRIHILGLSAVLDQIQRRPAPHPRHLLLSMREWRRAFQPYVVDEPTQSVG